jgi:hypothetical protein
VETADGKSVTGATGGGGSSLLKRFPAEKKVEVVFNDKQVVLPPYSIRIRRVADEEYLVKLFDGGKLAQSNNFRNDTDQHEVFVQNYVPNTANVVVQVVWTGDRPGGSPPELSDIYVEVNGKEYHYGQNNGLDWNGGKYGKAVSLLLKPE